MPVKLVLLNVYKFASIIQTDCTIYALSYFLLRHQNSQTVSAAGILSHQLSYEGPKQWKSEANC